MNFGLKPFFVSKLIVAYRLIPLYNILPIKLPAYDSGQPAVRSMHLSLIFLFLFYQKTLFWLVNMVQLIHIVPLNMRIFRQAVPRWNGISKKKNVKPTTNDDTSVSVC